MIASSHSVPPVRSAGPVRRVWGVLLGAIALSLLAGGYWTAQWRADAIDRDLRARLLSQAVAVARTISVEQVRALTFTKHDRAKLEFQQMREQMQAYLTVTYCRGIYSLVHKGEALVFGPETYAEDDPQASSPGTVYEQPTAELRAIFQTRLPFTEGPVTDEYGTFISALAPVIDPATGEVLMVIGLDVEATDWLAALAHERRMTGLWVGILAALLGGGAWVLHWREWLPMSRQSRLRHIEPVLVAFCGLGFTWAMVLAARDTNARSRRAIFQELAEAHAGRVVKEFADLRSHELSALARYCQNDETLSREGFRHFAASIVREDTMQIIQSLAWIPAVLAADRAGIEAAARADGLADFGFWQHGADDRREPAAARDVYFPVWLTEPIAGNEGALGFDHGAEPVRRAAMEAARRTGLPAITDRVTLIRETETSAGLLVYQAVFAGAPSGRVLRGYALVVLRADSFLRATQTSQADDGEFTQVDLYQLKAGQPPQHLASAGSGVPQHASALTTRKLIHGEGEASAIFPVFAFGKCYGLVFRPGRAFLAAYPSPGVWENAFWSLLLTIVLTAYATFVVRHRAGLEARTAELRTTLYSIGEAVVSTDMQGRVRNMNPVAENLTGWREADAVGERLATVYRVVDETTRRATADPIGPVLQQGRPAGTTSHAMLIARDGTERPITATAAPIRDGHGAVSGLVLAFSDQTAHQQAEQALRDSLAGKEALLKEVHHRVKNNLQVIVSLLRLEAGRSDHPQAQAMLQNMKDRIRSMALLHETICRSENLAEVDLASYLAKLANQLIRSLTAQSSAIRLRLKLQSVVVDADQAISCGLLVNELMTNALKHGYPAGRAGEVGIELSPVAGGPQFVLRVSDDGVGLPADFAAKQGKSLGLQLVADLVRQMKGTLEIGGGPGAVFAVTFAPIQSQRDELQVSP